MDYNRIESNISKKELYVEDLDSAKNGLDSVANTPASNAMSYKLGGIVGTLRKLKKQLQVFSSVLRDMGELKKKNEQIKKLIKQIESINIYKTNPLTKKTEIDQSKLQEKEHLEQLRDNLIKEYLTLKESVQSRLNSLFSGNESTDSGGTASTSKCISYDDALVVANKLQVPVDYILSLNLHEGYKLGDKIIMDGITPDMIHYAGEHGYPILIDGLKDMGSGYYATGRGKDLYKSSTNFTTVGPGKEYNITGQPVTFEEMEGRNVYWTWYGPIVQGFGKGPAPIQCTATHLYPCDDGLYRDGDGYIVIAGSPYKNQFYDGVHVNFDAHGGLAEDDMYVLTPFGIGKFYDNGAILIQNGIECDIYRNDGYESNNIAKTEYGRRLRSSAVAKYESLNLHWRDLIH